MKLFGLCFLFFAASAQLASPIDEVSTLDNVIEFTKGLTFGLGTKLGVEEFITCASEGY